MADILEILLRTAVTVAVIILLTRLAGLRSFSKMSGFDFAITVAMGSVLAGAVTTLSTAWWKYVISLAALFLVQILLARCRTQFKAVETTLDNSPRMIMENGEILEDNLKESKMTKADLYGKLREANAIDVNLVRAVVFEATGDVSVLHKQAENDRFSEVLLQGVKR